MDMMANEPMNDMPPMGNDEGMMDDGFNEEPMDGQQQDNMNLGNDDDTKEVQELSGKLSQKLGEINSAQPNSDLSKYAANMVLAQAAKGLDSSDAEDVKSKLNDIGNDEQNQGQELGNMEMPMESFSNFKKMVNEIVNQVLNDSNRERQEKDITNQRTKRKNPFNPDRN